MNKQGLIMAAGVVMIAILLAIVFWFLMTLVMMSAIRPPEAQTFWGQLAETGNHLSSKRIWNALAGSIILTGGISCFVARKVVSD